MVDGHVLAAIDQSAYALCVDGDVAGYLRDIEAIKESGAIEDHRLWLLANAFVWLHGGGAHVPMTVQ